MRQLILMSILSELRGELLYIEVPPHGTVLLVIRQDEPFLSFILGTVPLGDFFVLQHVTISCQLWSSKSCFHRNAGLWCLENCHILIWRCACSCSYVLR